MVVGGVGSACAGCASCDFLGVRGTCAVLGLLDFFG